MLRQPFEVAPSGENETGFATFVTFEDFRGRDPACCRAFSLDHARLPIAGRALRDEEERVEPPHRMELRDPPSESDQTVRVEFDPAIAEQVGEWRIGDQRV